MNVAVAKIGVGKVAAKAEAGSQVQSQHGGGCLFWSPSGPLAISTS